MDSRLELMDHGAIRQTLLKMALPTMVSLIITGLYNFVDSFFVAMLGTDALSAIAICYPFLTLVPGFSMLFGCGGASVISEFLGAGDREKAETVVSSSLVYSVVFSLLAVCSVFFLPQLLTLLGASAEVLPLALQYGNILVPALFFNITSITLLNLVRSEGNVALSTRCMIISSVMNVILDPIFMFVFDWGIAGAAWATAISQCFSCVMLLYYYISGHSYLKLDLRRTRLVGWIIKPMFTIGFPLFTVNLFQSISLSVLNIAAATYGDGMIAALGVANRIIGISTLAVAGFSRGYQTIVYYNFGAGHMDRIRQFTKEGYRWSMLGTMALSILQVVFATPICRAFSKEDDVVRMAATALIAASVLFFLDGYQQVASVLLLCIRHNTASLVFSMCRQGIVFIPLLFLLKAVLGQEGIYWAQAAADLLTSIIVFFYLLYLKKSGDKAAAALV